MSSLTGNTLGKYILGEQLGRGGMAEVYKAHHPVLNRYVTIKVLHSFLGDENFLARFKREARAVASLRHAHIQQIHDFDFDGDHYYMVMEYIDWGTLQDLMVQQSRKASFLPYTKVLSIMEQVSAALDYAHDHGVIHRDIKPSNILLDSDGNAFLSDFGIARMMNVTQFTTAGSLIGTPTYMSPEQCRGEELTSVSDIYSLGIILYEMLTGKVPFTSETTPLVILQKHIAEPPPAPRLLRPDLPKEVEQVVFKVLSKEPRKRYQSAGDLVRDLEKSLGGKSAAHEPASALGVAARSGLLTELVETPSPDRAEHPTELLETPSPDRAERPTELLETIPPADLTGQKEVAQTRPAGLAAKVDIPQTAGSHPSAVAESGRSRTGRTTSRLPLVLGFIGLLGLGGVCLLAGWQMTRIFPNILSPISSSTPGFATINPALTAATPTAARQATMIPSLVPTLDLSQATSNTVPTSTIPNANSTPTAFIIETSTPLPSSIFYDDFSSPAFDGKYNTNLWVTWEKDASDVAYTQHDGMLSIQQTAGVAALLAKTYGEMHLAVPMSIEAKVKLDGQTGHAYVSIQEANFGVICSLFTSGMKGSILCFDPLSSKSFAEFPVNTAQDWHDIRLMVSPDTMTFAAYVDGQKLFSAVPPNALKYQNSSFSFRIGVYDNGTVTGDFEDVIIGEADK